MDKLAVVKVFLVEDEDIVELQVPSVGKALKAFGNDKVTVLLPKDLDLTLAGGSFRT